MNNLAQMIARVVQISPASKFGTFQQHDRLDQVVARATKMADDLRAAGLGRGDVAAVIGFNSAAYLVTWMAAQLAGVQTALINPGYPDELLAEMLDNLAPRALIFVGKAAGGLAERQVLQLDAGGVWDGELVTLREGDGRPAPEGGGEDCEPGEISAYMHTSGTSGTPKFCALSHEYFLRLARYFNDVGSVTRDDTVVAPLPLFHINPMGYGVIGALHAGANMLSTEKFSAPEFWPEVKRHEVTAVVLHGPPGAVLRAKTTPDDARGHKIRFCFAAGPLFLEQFDIPIGLAAYGSTEAGGLCHTFKYRQGDRDFPPEGATHRAGQARYDLEWKLSANDEIMVRGKVPNVLFSGYAKDGKIDPTRDADGWFLTGDRGRIDANGDLVFVERASESIRVNGEYVPIDFVEERLRKAASLQDFALWRLDAGTRGHTAVVYTTSPKVDLAELRESVAALPKYMHPTKVIRIETIPRDTGVGKVQRRLLGAQPVLETVDV